MKPDREKITEILNKESCVTEEHCFKNIGCNTCRLSIADKILAVIQPKELPKMNPKAQEDLEKIDRNKILDKLAEKDYVDILHRQIKEGLIGTLRNEYMLTKPMREPYEKYSECVNTFVSLPIFHAMVDMMTSNLLYSTGEKFVNLICDVIEEQAIHSQMKKLEKEEK